MGALVGQGAAEQKGLTCAEIEGLPRLLRDDPGSFLVVRTDQGAFAALLVSAALRRAPGQSDGGAPVVIVERFSTFEAGRSGSRLAKGQGVILFEGFLLDLDSGIVVPEGQGGDLAFLVGGNEAPRLRPAGASRLFAPRKWPEARPSPPGPSLGKSVLPGDFDGRYRLFADGRWSGLLELTVGEGKQVTGRFRSEPLGNSYPVLGSIDPNFPNTIAFTIQFPRSEQSYEGRLWSEGKWAMAGKFTMMDRDHGFFAVREGTKTSLSD